MRGALSRVAVLVWCCFILKVAMVKHSDFKTCDQSGFCKRNREFANEMANSKAPSAYTYELKSILEGTLKGVVYKATEGGPKRFPIDILFYRTGAVRITMDEEDRYTLGTDGNGLNWRRFDQVDSWAFSSTPKELDASIKLVGSSADVTRVEYGSNLELRITHSPLLIEFFQNGEVNVALNEAKLLQIDHYVRPDGDQDTSESFNGFTDTRPRGDESVNLDVTFHGYDNVFGLAEHGSSLSLKQTKGGSGAYDDPYRLFNTDVFEYDIDSPMALYGSIPLIHAHGKSGSAGVFWINSAETWVDITKDKKNILSFSTSKTNMYTHWMSESGRLDLVVFQTDKFGELMRQYSELTGFTSMPPMWALGYHQCRWNYVSQDDVLEVDAKFDEHELPYDTIWLDVEYTNGKRYFTWDANNFPKPETMLDALWAKKRYLVAIIDPHIKKDDDYSVYKELVDQGLALKNPNNEVYEGWCWPGNSVWADFFNDKAREWWSGLFKFDKFKGSRPNLWLWNDMNEPAIFNGPEISSPRDNRHFGGWEHRDLHNLNGMSMINASHQALLQRSNERPFILSRSFFAGSQRLGAIWTGDNAAKWEHLAASVPMLLTLGISGYPFAGADVGGFFGDPSNELLVRWYQTGIFYPFFRAHAHIDTKRREPWIPGEPYTSMIRNSLKVRYALLPVLYTAFHQANTLGLPILRYDICNFILANNRPNFMQFPGDDSGYAIDDQFYYGDSGILVKPVSKEAANHITIYLSDDQPYYSYFSFKKINGPGLVKVESQLDTIPMYIRGGSIFARKDRIRASTFGMTYDPYTLIVALSADGTAEGTLYIDDGISFDFQKGQYITMKFTYDANNKRLSSTSLHPDLKKSAKFRQKMKDVRVERIILLGDFHLSHTSPAGTITQKRKHWEVSIYRIAAAEKEEHLIVRDPRVVIGEEWNLHLE